MFLLWFLIQELLLEVHYISWKSFFMPIGE